MDQKSRVVFIFSCRTLFPSFPHVANRGGGHANITQGDTPRDENRVVWVTLCFAASDPYAVSCIAPKQIATLYFLFG